MNCGGHDLADINGEGSSYLRPCGMRFAIGGISLTLNTDMRAVWIVLHYGAKASS